MLTGEQVAARGKEYLELLVKDFVAYADDVNRSLSSLDTVKAASVFAEMVAQFRADAQQLSYALDAEEPDDDEIGF